MIAPSYNLMNWLSMTPDDEQEPMVDEMSTPLQLSIEETPPSECKDYCEILSIKFFFFILYCIFILLM